ncbi:MAG: hypothetical protein A2W08_05885 [Candidatus Rokubacteria bacterium RBG_16_73_20]|nr:MAG: hypothetical protein A2050_17015 [Candidatus Rokubacteria bacterium GWA2_73_35]OGK91971.1 MAG: hypothetical protein A2W08_05885 [Candidatus Rokubacteria bacterium RBG_16_73_20]HBH02313.1 hypothetical protein [Candidatus Rokubacteria bacterium]
MRAAPGAAAALLLWALLVPAGALRAQGTDEIRLEDIEKEIARTVERPYHLGGFLEFQPTLFGLDRDAAFYRLQFFDRDEGATAAQYDLRLRLEGSYRKDIFSLFVRADALTTQGDLDSESRIDLLEGFGSLKPVPGLALDAGKKVVKWGKGYAWNPVAFIDRPKNPEDPELALEGFYLVAGEAIRSFDGPLKTVAFTAIALPVDRDVNEDFGETDHLNVAAKLYALLFDTDLDVMVFTGGSRTTRFGVDFARNILTNFEVHGEWALIRDVEQAPINERGQAMRRVSDVMSYLVGIRYLTERETTFIVEYYHNGPGFTGGQMEDFFRFVEAGDAAFRSTGNTTAIRRAITLAEGAYGRPNPMRSYFYARASQKEPFDILYFTPALTTIVNVEDRSFVVIPELIYSPVTNLELRFRAAALVGEPRTEYGEKQNDYRLELRVRYYF